MNNTLKIENLLRDVSARRLRKHKVAKKELLALADHREYFYDFFLFIFLFFLLELFFGEFDFSLCFEMIKVE